MMESSSSLPQINTGTSRQWLARYSVWVLGGVTGLLILVGFSLGLVALVNSDGAMNPFTHLFFLPFGTAIYGLIGLLIVRRYPGNLVGWLLLLVGMFSAVTLLSGAYTKFAQFTLSNPPALLRDVFIWLDRWAWVIPSMVPLTLLLLYFPDGRLLSVRWRWIVRATVAGIAGMMIAAAFYPTPLPEFGLTEHNPYGIPGSEAMFGTMLNLTSAALLIGLLGAFASVMVRYRRSRGVQRQQIKWLLYAAGLILVALVIMLALWLVIPESAILVEAGIMLNSGGVTLIIVVIGIAILRHNLWDVDTVINRTLVYGLLTLIVIGMYVLVVSFLSVLFDSDNLLFSLMATGLVAVSFQSLRDAVQTRVSRLLFGQRDDPYRVVQKLSAQLEPLTVVQDILPLITSNIAVSLQLPYVGVMLKHDGGDHVVAAYPSGMQRPRHVESIPLIYQMQTIGQLMLAPRSRDEAFTPSEIDLLQTIARQVAVAAYNVRLTEDLQRSRQEIVTAREEERRRLRRDLHDGLGPVLAAMSFRLDAVRNFVEHDPDQARKLIDELKSQVQSSLSEVRRIAYNLRPPALDELGLLGALRQHIEATLQTEELRYVLDFPAGLPPLPAAVEVAAYRIVIEAVTNVQRHANAAHCMVRIHPDKQYLCLEIIDDGCGIDAGQGAGVGLTAMRERTAELGGRFSIQQSAAGGTQIQASLPTYVGREV